MTTSSHTLNPWRWLLALTGAASLLLTSCDKVWEVGQKLKAPEEPEVLVEPTPEPIKAQPIEVPLPPPVEKKPKVNEDAQVSILGYHDFSQRPTTNDMIMEIGKFREQMETLKQNHIPVIPMSDYVAWKRGEKSIPDPCVVITMDDGWEAVYTLAFPVLKEYGYPFSIYVYKNYVNLGGRSLSWDQIREMMENGCEVGSHSVSHHWLTKPRGNSEEEKEAWLVNELKGSLEFLRENLGDEVIPVFAYPYGAHNEQVRLLAGEGGYDLAVTVAPRKAGHKSEDLEVGRYIIHGTNNTNFEYAMSFGGSSSLASSQSLLTASDAPDGAQEEALVSTSPENGEVISTRLPLIQVDVSRLEGVIPSSIRMQVAGFGSVPLEYNPEKGLISYRVPQRLRSESCKVSVQLRRQGESKDDYVSWAFKIDRTALYLNAAGEEKSPESGNAPAVASSTDSTPAPN